MALHVVFGAGQIGANLARTLAARGHTVRVVRRSARPIEGAPSIEVVSGDAMHPAFAVRATEGASVIYHCMNPSAYTAAAWTSEFPRQGAALVAAALAHDALLVCLDNLYCYGEVDRRTEGSPMAATGPKGRSRIAWDTTLRSTAGLRYAVGRAGDFFGPGAADNSLFSPKLIEGLRRGDTAWIVGDATAPHAFSFVPDVVDGLAALGEGDARGVFHLPMIEVPPGELVSVLAAAVGSSARARALPAWSVNVLGVAVPLFRELRETLYQWDRPFHADDRKFRARFPEVGHTLESAVAATMAAGHGAPA